VSLMITLDIPPDARLCEALGRLAVAHGNLEMVQLMCLKTLQGLTPGEALERFRKTSARDIRKLIEEEVAQRARPHQKAAQDKLQDLLLDARSASRRRNAFVHRFWGCEPSGNWLTSFDGNRWEPLPTIPAVEDLVEFTRITTARLNSERMQGGLIFALAPSAAGSQEDP
jgi:hypothetical protein